MIGHMLGRSVTRLLACAAVVSVIALLPSAVSAASSSALEGRLDVAEFSERAASYAFAYSNHRAEALDRAEDLAREGHQAEREEEQRLAALAVTRAAERARIATTVPPTTVPPTTVPPAAAAPTTTLVPAGGPTAEQWAALRHCESGGRYDALSPTGSYRGAYQFSRATWDWVAGVVNPSLVGVDPAAASAADQDAQALALYDMSGPSPWPWCGVHLQ
ncbi:MAG: transglycosylase family protein [Acidimicrobiales bacterium]|nr:transglycosylase family protein [Acidimicrobiales bacterium]MDG2216867.1 transglycosylase family protein [Acidimicrobiales bacterium]